jgi:hypothetical protein
MATQKMTTEFQEGINDHVAPYDPRPTIAEWLKKYIGTESEIEFIGFQASPSRIYSELTHESFAVDVIYRCNGSRLSIWLDDVEVARMLNEVFPPGQTKEET